MQRLNKSTYIVILALFLVMSFGTNVWPATKGKIAGQVIERDTQGPLPGVNIVIEGTSLGAAADEDGFFFIINLSPGTYTLKAIMVGYATVIQENVQVSVNQTTNVNFIMQPETLEGETVVVTATRPVVQLDVSSSQRVISEEAIQDRPLENFEEILSAEVGIQLDASEDGTGFIVRGGRLNETDIVIDGLSVRNERNQQPATNLSLTAIQEVEILTGGFNAEFGNIRSGMINVITKEGSLDRFAGNMDVRISPPARKHFGPSPFSTDGPFWQVYAGPDAFTGVTDEMVNSGQYPFTFIGWNEVSRQFISDPDPTNDLTPQEALEVWKWQHRIRKYAEEPDYIADISFSGPIPGTPVAFLLSQRYENLQLVYPFSRNNSIASTTLLKLTTYLTPTMKLSFNNIYMHGRGVSGGIYDDTVGMINGSREGTSYGRNAFYWRYIWHDANFNPIKTDQYRGGFSLNHVLSAKTYYDVKVEFTTYKTVQEPIGLRDTTAIKKIGNNWYDEAPWGYLGSVLTGGGVSERYDILGDFLMSGGGRGQDHSKYWGIAIKADFVSQIDKHNQIKTGFTFDYTSFKERREINHSETSTPWEEAPWRWWYYDSSPIKLGVYIQDKLEYGGMIANLGLRLDYLQTGSDPHNLDPNFIFENNPYTLDNFRAGNNSFSQFTTDEKSYKLYLSPRAGISHPITATSKIFFNYGHSYQPPVADSLYTVRPRSRGATVPNIAVDWPLTISYELGFEQSVAQDFLIHLMGYYKDVSNHLRSQSIISLDAENTVDTYSNNSYADIRGLELKLEKRVGRWWYGWISLEYMIRSTGHTGLRYVYEDRQLANQQREQTNQDRGWPVPSVVANITLKTPEDYGPEFAGHKWLGGWRLNVLQEWSDGGKELLNPEAILSDQHYAEWIDWWKTDLLLEKRIQLRSMRLGFYMQVKNLFNFKGPVSPQYWNRYVESLKFPWEHGDQKGNDKLGEWDKPWIDIGWNTWAHFINPRDIFFGIRIQF